MGRLLTLLLASSCYFKAVSCLNETALIDAIFVGYNANGRPVTDASRRVEVTIGLEIRDFRELNDVGETMTFVGFFVVSWIDEFLVWDVNNYSLSYIAVDATDVWLPDLIITNSIDGFFKDSYREG